MSWVFAFILLGSSMLGGHYLIEKSQQEHGDAAGWYGVAAFAWCFACFTMIAHIFTNFR